MMVTIWNNTLKKSFQLYKVTRISNIPRNDIKIEYEGGSHIVKYSKKHFSLMSIMKEE